MNERVLIVDDDEELLNSFRRHFYKLYQLDTATNAEEGLKLLKENQYLVVVSDYMMPKMDGIRFLTLAKDITPDTTRIMLTGNADIKTAMQAVNEGCVYRFLTKPCAPEALAQMILAGIEYNQLLTAERVLLEQTLNGSISMLVEILSLVNPEAFSKALRIKKFVTALVKKLNISPAWCYEMAATLSQIGFVTLPPNLLEKIYLQKSLTAQEQTMLNNHPHIARKLIEKIPRLEIIAPMIEDQRKIYVDFPMLPGSSLPKEPAVLGAQILKVAIDYDDLAGSGYTHADIMHTMETRKGYYNFLILSAVAEPTISSASWERRMVFMFELKTGMVVDEDITTTENVLLLRRGHEVTETVLARMSNVNSYSKIKAPFQVLIPRKEI